MTLDRRPVGSAAPQVSVLALGCTNFGPFLDQREATEVVAAAIDHGITYFDTADIYGLGESERMLGRALRGRRDEFSIGTKFSCPMSPDPRDSGASAPHVTAACEASLRRLGTDHIDVYWMHYPDPRTPIEETLGALDALVRAGKVLALGASNLAGWQVADADAAAARAGTERFVTLQCEWSLLARSAEAELVPACTHHGLSLMAYSPLAFGLLTGKYRRGAAAPDGSRLARQPYATKIATAENFARVEALEALAMRHGSTLLGLALSWLASRPGVASVIAAATSPQQVAANAASATTALDASILAEIDRIVPPPPGPPQPPTFDAIERGARRVTR